MADVSAAWRGLPARGTVAMAAEAMWELARARLDTLRPARHYTRHLGRQGAEAPQDIPPAQYSVAARIGYLVARVAAIAPFRAVCLQQVLAVRRMLNRRGVPATIYLGLSRDSDAEVGVHVSNPGSDHGSAPRSDDDPALSASDDAARARSALAAAARPGRRAHAWVKAGGYVVNGNVGLQRFAVVGTFS